MGHVYEPEVLPPEPAESEAIVVAPRVVSVDIDINQILGIGVGMFLDHLFRGRNFSKEQPAPVGRKRASRKKGKRKTGRRTKMKS